MKTTLITMFAWALVVGMPFASAQECQTRYTGDPDVAIELDQENFICIYSRDLVRAKVEVVRTRCKNDRGHNVDLVRLVGPRLDKNISNISYVTDTDIGFWPQGEGQSIECAWVEGED